MVRVRMCFALFLFGEAEARHRGIGSLVSRPQLSSWRAVAWHHGAGCLAP